MNKVVIKLLQGLGATQTGSLCAKNYESWLTVDEDIAIIIRLTLLAHRVYGVHLVILYV